MSFNISITSGTSLLPQEQGIVSKVNDCKENINSINTSIPPSSERRFRPTLQPNNNADVAHKSFLKPKPKECKTEVECHDVESDPEEQDSILQQLIALKEELLNRQKLTQQRLLIYDLLVKKACHGVL